MRAAPRFAAPLFLLLLAPALLGGVNRWTTSGPADNVTSLALVSAAPGTLYVTTFQGIYRSGNHGASWELVNSSLVGDSAVWRIAVDPFNPSTLYSTGRGVFKSVDGGLTWETITPSAAPTYFIGNALLTDPQRRGRIYVGGSFSGLFRSDDEGVTWHVLGLGTMHEVTNVSVNPHNASHLFVGANYGRVFRSLDAGASWSEVLNHGNSVVQIVFDAQTNAIYTVGYYYAQKSVDGGSTWNVIDGNLRQTIAIDPRNSAIVYGARGGEVTPGGVPAPPVAGVYRSTDGGVSASPFNVGLSRDAYPNTLLIGLSGDFLYLGSSRGVFCHEIRTVANSPLRLVPTDQTVAVGQLPAWTATLDFIQGADTTVSLGSSNQVLLLPPPSVTIPAGSPSAPFSGSRYGTGRWRVGGQVTITAVVPESLGGGITTARATFRPVIQRLVPDRTIVGGPDFVLSVVGYSPDAEFTPNSVIYWRGLPRPTSIGCPLALIAILSCVSTTIPASELTTPGTPYVFVENPDAITNFLPFTIGGEALVDVPTLGEWGRLGFTILLAAAALLVLARMGGRG